MSRMYRCTVERPDGSTYEQDCESPRMLRRCLGRGYMIVDARDITDIYFHQHNEEDPL